MPPQKPDINLQILQVNGQRREAEQIMDCFPRLNAVDADAPTCSFGVQYTDVEMGRPYNVAIKSTAQPSRFMSSVQRLYNVLSLTLLWQRWCDVHTTL